MSYRSVFLFLILSSLGLLLYSATPSLLAMALIWSLVVAALHWRMEATGKYSRYRTIYFLCLALSFCAWLQLAPKAGANVAPYCHLSLASGILHTGSLELKNLMHGNLAHYGALGLGGLWLIVLLLASGGSACGWICFFGGVDDTLSQVLKKPLLNLPGGRRWREFQLAVLIFAAFLSFIYMEPVFCQWICPFKSRDEVLNLGGSNSLMQTLSYGAVALGFLIVLPVLTRKRTFCDTLCPFGALPPLFRRLNPHRLMVLDKFCSACGTCEETCPSFAIEAKGKKFAVNQYCTLCLRCVSACPEKAIQPALFSRPENRILPLVSLGLGGALSIFYLPPGLLALAGFVRGLLPW